MSGAVVLFPIVLRPSFADRSWCEQYRRQIDAQMQIARGEAPPRTRPILMPDDRAPCWQAEGMPA